MLAQSSRVKLGLMVVLAGLVVLVSGCEGDRRPDRYLIPEGFVGGITVVYGVKGAPPLPVENGFYLIKIPPDGLLKTSTPIECGAAKDEYQYYFGARRRPLKLLRDGGRGLIWGGEIGDYGVPLATAEKSHTANITSARPVGLTFAVGPEQRASPDFVQDRRSPEDDPMARLGAYAITFLLGFSILNFCWACYREQLPIAEVVVRITALGLCLVVASFVVLTLAAWLI